MINTVTGWLPSERDIGAGFGVFIEQTAEQTADLMRLHCNGDVGTVCIFIWIYVLIGEN